MAKLEHELMIQHFSHGHPLELINLNHPSMDFAACAGCNLKLFGWVYGCRACDYYIDITCSKLPRRINHGAHPLHTLSLHTSPVYPEGSFHCDACGQKGKGFCFHCDDCELDLHVTCAAKPLLVQHGGHDHPLGLTISSPYGKKGFVCDVCRGPGSNRMWLYRCKDCEFDAHLCCVIRDSSPGGRSHKRHHRMDPPPPGCPHHPLQQSPAGSTGLGDGPVGNVVQEFLSGMAQQVGQDAMQAILGGDSSGVDVGSAVVGAMIGTN